MGTGEQESSVDRAKSRVRLGRVLGWAAKALGLVVIVVVLLVAGALLYLRTDAGLAQLARLIEMLGSSEQSRLAIGRLEGPFPEHLRIENVSLTDDRGTLVSLDYAELRWRPWKLLSRRLDVTAFDIGTIAVSRLPAQQPAARTQAAGPTRLPSLPVDLRVESFRLTELQLGEAILGQPARITAAASLDAERQGQFAANVDARRIDGIPTNLSLLAHYDTVAEHLKIDIDADEPSAGLVGSLLRLPGAPPLRLQVKGDGPVTDWHGTLKAAAGELAGLDTDVHLSGSDPLRVTVDGSADAQGLLPPNLAPLTTGGLALKAVADVRSERITLDELGLSTAAGSLHGVGAFIPGENRIDGKATLTLGPPTVLQSLVPGIGYDSASADILLSGKLPVPNVELDALAENPTSGSLRAGKAAVRAKVTSAEGTREQMPPLDGQAELIVSEVVASTKGAHELLEQPLRLAFDGRYDPAGKHAIVRQLRLDAGSMQLAGHADLDLAEKLAGTAVLGTNDFEIAPFGPLFGTSLAGKARLNAILAADQSGTLRAQLRAGIEHFTSAMPELTALVGASPTLAATVSGNPASAVDFDAKAMTAQFSAVADGRVSSHMSVIDGAKLRVEAADLRGLRSIVGAPIAGAFSVNAEAKGPVDKLTGSLHAVADNVIYQDQRIDRLRLTADARDVPSNANGSLALDAATSLGPLTARSSFAMDGSQRLLRVDPFVLTYAEKLTAIARLLVPFDGRPIVGNVGVHSDDLTPVGRALKQQFGGRLDLDMVLDEARGAQRVAANLRGNELRYGPPTAPTAGVDALSANVEMTDPLAERRLQALVNASDIRAAGGHLATATVRATGAKSAYEVEAAANGDMQGLTQLASEAEVIPAETTVITLRRLQAMLKNEPLRLVRPTQITVGGDRLGIDDLAVTYGKAQATLALAKSSRQLDGRLALRDFDLALVEKFQAGTRLGGAVNADAELSGTPAAPLLNAQARAAGIGLADVRQRVQARTPKLNALLTAHVGAGRGAVDLTAEGLGNEPLRASMSAPVRFAVEPFTFALEETGPIEGAVKWQGDIDPLFQLLPIDAFLVSGYTNVDLAIAGTVGKPAITGEVALTRGSLDAFQTGTVLRPLELAVTASEGEWRLTRLDARDGGDGTLAGNGAVSAGEPQRVDARLELHDFAALRRDDVVAKLGGAVAADGTIGERLLVSGRIENEGTEIRLVNRLPPSVVNVNVVFDDQPQAKHGVAAHEEQRAGLGWIVLDLTVVLPGRVFVRGRGLDSEWAGSLTITGTVADPQVHGSLEPVRGNFDVLGKRFNLDKGKIAIQGLQDISIDLTASYQRADLKALVLVSGTATEPKITLESDPPMPQDEILSRVLFDKSTGSLSVGEAAQLASAAATLASGEPGVLDKLRTATGLDRLSLGGSQESSGLGAVEAGKNLGNNVYVGVEQGASPTSTEAVVEVGITNNLKLRSTTSAEGSNRVGLRWEWDY